MLTFALIVVAVHKRRQNQQSSNLKSFFLYFLPLPTELQFSKLLYLHLLEKNSIVCHNSLGLPFASIFANIYSISLQCTTAICPLNMLLQSSSICYLLPWLLPQLTCFLLHY